MIDDVYEPSESTTEHNPYDTKVGGKPACTLADGTTPQTVKQQASTADGPAAGARQEPEIQTPAEKPKVSKAAREHAEANGVELTDLEGTGQDGLITKADVQKVIDARNLA